MKNLRRLLRTIAETLRQTVSMADIYSLVGIVAFAAAMLGLIWVLERV
jgi:catalase (peroxidase I)